MNEFGDNEVEFTKGSSYIMSNKGSSKAKANVKAEMKLTAKPVDPILAAAIENFFKSVQAKVRNSEESEADKLADNFMKNKNSVTQCVLKQGWTTNQLADWESELLLENPISTSAIKITFDYKYGNSIVIAKFTEHGQPDETNDAYEQYEVPENRNPQWGPGCRKCSMMRSRSGE